MARSRAPHIVAMPNPGFRILRIFQIVIAICILGLLAYLAWVVDTVLYSFGTTIITASIGVGLFSICLTLIYCIYYSITSQCAPKGYNYWAVMTLECLCVLFWLISFALLADFTAQLVAANSAPAVTSDDYYYSDCSDSDYYCYAKRAVGVAKRDTVDSGSAIVYAAFALAAIEWVLFMVSLVLFSIRMHRHRLANGPVRTNGDMSHSYTPKQMEAQNGPMPMPSPEYQGQMPVQRGFVQQPMH